jgi:hypothetical protein
MNPCMLSGPFGRVQTLGRSSVVKSFPFKTALVLFALLAFGLTAIEAQISSRSQYPANVPDEYVGTPSGYFHPSCVRQVARGETLLAGGRILQHADGTLENIAACEYPHYNARGEIVDATSERTPEINGWVEYFDATTSTSYGLLYGYWTVPPNPTSNDGQILYFFNGLEDVSDTVSIIQPVLAWNGDTMVSNAWSIASWNCCPSGITWHSSPIAVSSGDALWGITGTNCGGQKSCSTWDITTYDLSSNKSTALSNTPSEGQTFNWAFPAVLEAYNVFQCSDYPPNGSETFYNVALADYNDVDIPSPGWTYVDNASGDTPQCGYRGQMSTTQGISYTAETLLFSSLPQAPAPTYTITHTWGPATCGNIEYGYNNPCYEIYTATVTVAQGETLYVNGSAVSGTTYTDSVQENWGTGSCGYYYYYGEYYLCSWYATPSTFTAYATKPGYIPSATVAVDFY